MRNFVIFSKTILLLVLILNPKLVEAQVGINTTSPKEGSILDISSTDKGVFIPKVDISSISSISPITGINNLANAQGLLVYNENTSTGPGLFCWSGSIWEPIGGSGSGDDWKLSGNSGTTPGTNFIGTSDSQNLIFKTNGSENMRVLTDGRISINETAPIIGDLLTVTGNIGDYAINGYGTSGGVGVYGQDSSVGIGVYGTSSSTGQGVRGFNNGTGYAIAANNSGSGIGVLANSVSNTAIQAQNSTSGYGIASFSQTAGIYNEVSAGYGQYNVIESNSFGIWTEMITAGGTGEIVDLGVQDGTGFLAIAVNNISSPTNGGDVFGFESIVKTSTASSGTVYGSAYAGEQSGVGHGILITHSGNSGRNAEFNITNSNNTDPAIFSIHDGQGSVIVGQNQNNSISGTLTVADFSYTGNDNDDHIGVSGYSVPRNNKGVGVEGTGGLYGVLGINTTGNSNYAIYGNGDIGTSGAKSFVIDHPNDPANKLLKHFSIESNEVINLYRGMEVFDSSGRAIVQLPEYYSSINKNASYQLTPIGASMPNLFIEQEANGTNTFIIAGGISGKKVSWILTAERDDPYLQQHPNKRNTIIDKGENRGKYQMPALYNQPLESGIFYKELITTKSSKNNKAEISNLKSSSNISELKPENSKFEDINRKQIKKNINNEK